MSSSGKAKLAPLADIAMLPLAISSALVSSVILANFWIISLLFSQACLASESIFKKIIGIFNPAGTLNWARAERIDSIRLTTQFISRSAAWSMSALSNSGQSQWTSISFLCERISHKSSVIKGIIGCSKIRHWSITHPIVCRVSLFILKSAEFKSGFESSTYQSQTVPQTKEYRTCAASLNLNWSKAIFTSLSVLTVSPTIQRFTVSFAVGTDTPKFASLSDANLAAFQSFVPKFL